MSTPEKEVRTLISQLPDECSLKGIQYHLYLIKKILKGIDRVETEVSVKQEEV